MSHGNRVKPGDTVTISKEATWFAGKGATVIGYHRLASFGGEMVDWYLVELAGSGSSFNFPSTWLEKEVHPCPMT